MKRGLKLISKPHTREGISRYEHFGWRIEEEVVALEWEFEELSACGVLPQGVDLALRDVELTSNTHSIQQRDIPAGVLSTPLSTAFLAR